MKKILNLVLLLVVGMFAITSASAQCDYTLDLVDSFGDGWNGNTVGVSIDGVVTEFTMAAGLSASTEVVSVPEGADLAITFATDGTFTGESSLTITDCFGVVVYDGALDPNGDDNPGDVLFAINPVIAPQPCEITCPDDIIATLGSGECATQISFVVETAGDCVNLLETTAGFVNDYDLAGAVPTIFGAGDDIVDASGAPGQLVLTSGDAGAFSTTVLTFTVTQSGLFSFDWSTLNSDLFSNFDAFGFVIQDAALPLTTFTVLAQTSGAQNGTFSQDVIAGETVSLVIQTQDGIGGSLVATINNVALTVDSGEALVETTPFANGDQVAPGVYTVTAQATDFLSGAPVACDFGVTVNAFVGSPQSFLQCGGGSNITLDNDCTATLGAEDVLVGGPYACFDEYTVVLTDAAGTVIAPASNVITGPGTVYYMVTGPNGENPCWNSVFVEDKTAPSIACEDVTVSCNDATSVAAIGQPTVDETCGGITLSHTDAVINGDCADGFLTQIVRTFTAVNASGMSATCTQTISVNRQGLADVTAPGDFDGFDQATLSCDANIALDANGNPATSVTGFPMVNGEDASEACGLQISYEDEVSSPCEGTTKIFRTWTIIDWCVASNGTGANRLDIVQFIKIEDKVGPTVSCAGSIDVSTDFDACTANVLLPVPALSDNCASTGSLSYSAVLATADGILVALPSGGFVAQGLPVGKSTIIYTGVDPCGNQSTCTMDINVTDQVAPAMSCETFRTVSLQNINPNEPTIIFAAAFDDGSYDNCEIASYEVRRMASCIDFDWTSNGAGIDSDANGFVNFRDRGTSAFYPAVPFACCDLGNTVMVELRITDIYGNSNSCMVEVEVEDKVNPIVSCPADVTIECLDEVPGLDFLSATESAAFNTPVFAGTPFNPGDFLGYSDGVIDNCGATLYIQEGGSVNDCGIGSFTRRLQAQDATGNLSTPCTQRITVINSNPFTENDITWPSDREINCGMEPTPEALNSQPNIQVNNACDIIAMTFEDFELPVINNEECRKILRTWTVTDHCQFELNNSTGVPTAGFWQYTQIIKVVDNETPVLACAPVAGSADANPVTCSGAVALTIEATGGTCAGEILRYTYAIDAGNDGSVDINGIGNDASGTYPTGEHSITWTVEDFCGNVGESCTQLFYVVDNTPPNIVALTETTVNLANGEAEVWPSEVEVSSFDVCAGIAQSLLVNPSLGDGQTSPPASAQNGDGASFVCADLGSNSADYWLQDGAGNWSYVTILVNVEDPQGFCGNGAVTASVAGTVATEENEMVDNTIISVDGSASTMPADVVTAADGAFAYDLELGQNYSIAAARNDNPLNGVSTYDLVLLGQHLLELNTLDSPYKMIAADINGSGSITSLDMIALRRLILFIDTELASNTSWRFVDGDYAFPNAANPFASTFPEVINYNDLAGSELADFVGIKIGDLNSSAAANALAAGDTRSSDGELVFNVEDAKVEAGQTYTVDFKATDFNQVAGYQFTLNFDANAVDFVDFEAGALRGLTAENFGFHMLNEGVITTSWNAANALSVSNDDVLFSLTFTAKAATQVSKVMNIAQSSEYTSAEAYNEAAELYDLTINFNSADNALFQNQPNPFRNETVIGFELAEAAAATVTVYDVAGRTIKQYNGDFAKGYNSLTINRSELSGSGVLYYQLETADFSATKKMILVD